MRVSRYVLLTILGGLSVSTQAAEEPITVSPALDLSYKRVDYTLRGVKVPSATLLSISPTLNLGRGRWYASLSYETPLEKYENISVQYPIGSSIPSIVTEQIEQTSATFTFGYRITEVWSVFGGYLKTRHDYNKLSVSTNAGVNPENINYQLDDSGIFVGAGYNFRVGSKGTIGVSLAYGDLDSKLRIVDGVTTITDIKAPSDGFSLNAVWSSPVSDALTLRIGARYTDYKTNTSLTTKHSYYTYFMGLASFF